MLAEERWNRICEIVNREQAVTALELAEQLQSSESTIRRDLIYLDRAQRIRKVRGGATTIAQEFISFESDMATKSEQNIEEKKAIGTYAASLIYDDDFIYIDAGTSTLALVDAIEHTKASFVTNGILHAEHLSARGCTVYLLGGALKSSTSALIGVQAINSIRRYNFTKCFLGVNGITKAQGYTTPDPEEGLLKQAAVEQSYLSYVLADTSKFQKVYAAQIASLKRACIITTKLKDESLLQETVIKEVGY